MQDLEPARLPGRQWYSIGESAVYLGVSPSTLKRAEAAGLLTAYRTPGRHRRFSKAELDQFAERRRRP